MGFYLIKAGLVPFTMLFICMFLMVKPLQAQNKTTTVRGLVQNDSNDPLAGVLVTMRNKKDDFMMGTHTDSAGIFTFDGVLPGGPYSFQFSLLSYKSQLLSVSQIKGGITLSILVTLISSTASIDQAVVARHGHH